MKALPQKKSLAAISGQWGIRFLESLKTLEARIMSAWGFTEKKNPVGRFDR
jgi:hypothetical protein